MYVIHDRLTPHIQEYTHASRIRNIILRHWPTIDYGGGNVVMAPLYMYLRSTGVQDTPSHRKIYKFLNIEIEDLRKEEWDGVDNYHLKWIPVDEAKTITDNQITGYIESNSPLVGTTGVSDWVTTTVSYVPVQAIDAYASDTTIVAALNSSISDAISFPTAGYDETTNTNEFINELLGIALMDTSNLLFEKQYVVKTKVLSPRMGTQISYGQIGPYKRSSTSYILSTTIEVKYRRKGTVNLGNTDVVNLINLIRSRLLAVDNPTAMSSVINNPLLRNSEIRNLGSRENSINKTLLNMYSMVVGYTDATLVYTHGGGILGPNSYILKSGLESMKAVDFVTFMGKSITTGYKKKKASALERIGAIVLGVIVIVVSAGAGAAAVAVGMSSSAAVFAFAAAFALNLSIGTLLLGVVAYVASEKGYVGFAAYLNKVIAVLGIVSTVVSIISIYSAFKLTLAKQVALEGATKAASTVGKDVALKEVGTTVIKDVAITDVGLDTLIETGKNMLFGNSSSLMSVLNKTISAINWVASFFMEKDMKALQGDLTSQQETLDAQSEELRQYEGKVDKVMYHTSDLYDGYYNPYFSEYELGTGEGYDRYHKTATHWRCQNSIDWVFPK